MQAFGTSPYLSLFENLLSGISDLLQSRPPAQPPGHDGPHVVPFDIGGQQVGLVYAPEKDPAALTIVCAFGPLPETGREEVLAQLLKVNYMTVGAGATLGMEPLGEEIVLAAQQPLEGAEPALVLASMGVFATLAAQWREGHFLGEPPAEAMGILHTGLRA